MEPDFLFQVYVYNSGAVGLIGGVINQWAVVYTSRFL